MSKTSLEKSVSSFQDKKRRCLEFLDETAKMRGVFDKAFPQFSRQEGDEPPRLGIEKIHSTAEKLAGEKLKILFAGQFKTGKSTLINAMLGQEVLPANVMPCTAVITEIEYAENPQAVLHFKNAVDIEHLPDGLNEQVAARLSDCGGKDASPLEVDISCAESLNDYLTITDLYKEHAQGVRESPIAKCVLHWPLPICQDGAVIIDSPGLNEAEARDRTTLGYLASADMIVHVLNALQLCGLPDKDFIARAQKIGNLPMLFVVNRFDALNNDRDRARLREAALKNPLLNGTYGQDGIFFTSAQKALEARMEKDDAALADSGVPEVEKKIARIFEEDRPKIKLGAMQAICDDLHIFSMQNLPDLQRQLDMDAGKLKAEFAAKQDEFRALEERIGRIRATVDACISSFVNDFQLRLENSLRAFDSMKLEEIVENAEISPISLMNRKADVERAANELCGFVWQGLQDGLMDWMRSEGARIYAGHMQEIGDAIHADVESFSHELHNLRRDLNLGALSIDGRKMDIDMELFLREIGNVGIAVGGLGAGLLFVGERFLPMLIAGPAGWYLMIVTTIGSLIWAAMTGSEKAMQKLKGDFLKEARKLLRSEIPRLVEGLSKDARDRMREEIQPLLDCLARQVDDARRPIESAIAVLEGDRQSIEAKKEEMEKFRVEFCRLDDEGRKLLASL